MPPIKSRSTNKRAKSTSSRRVQHENHEEPSRRIASVYDAVAGRIGVNGFLSAETQQQGNAKSLAPEEVLLRRVNAPQEVTYDVYNADEKLSHDLALPDADLLKDIHVYASEFFGLATVFGGENDFRSMDETALIALGILLEEGVKEALGETGDMVLTEPEQVEHGWPRNEKLRHQIVGSVVPRIVHEYESPTEVSDVDAPPRRRGQKRQYEEIQ